MGRVMGRVRVMSKGRDTIPVRVRSRVIFNTVTRPDPDTDSPLENDSVLDPIIHCVLCINALWVSLWKYVPLTHLTLTLPP